MKYVCMLLIKLYRTVLSPLKGRATCRFVPTCSEYAYEAYKVHGFFKGTALTVWRVLRCNPFGKGGFDPVPPKKKK